MQAIERYGVVALLLLIATVVAVLVWDGAPAGPSGTVAAADEAAAYRTAVPADEPLPEPRIQPREDPNHLELSGPARIRTLRRGEPDRERTDSRGGLVQTGYSGDEEEYGYGEEPVEEWTPPASAYYPPTYGGEPPVETSELRAQPEPRRRETTWQPERAEPTPVQSQPRPQRVADTRGGEARSYVIKKGDTLGEISLRELGTSKRWREILELNPKLNEKRLLVGNKILLPGASTPARESGQRTPERVAQAPAGAPTYEVQSGDSMWRIAKRLLGDGERYREIKALNPNIDADKLRVGQTLVLPADARTASQPIIASTETGTSRSRRVR